MLGFLSSEIKRMSRRKRGGPHGEKSYLLELVDDILQILDDTILVFSLMFVDRSVTATALQTENRMSLCRVTEKTRKIMAHSQNKVDQFCHRWPRVLLVRFDPIFSRGL